ncbi:MAG TPA: hypothetical protein VFI18_06110 [Gaiellales bacterium]|nr:hypothetical protein [Gaiellales bacterium]
MERARNTDSWYAALVGAVVVAAMAVTNARLLTSDTFYSLYSGRFIVAHGLPRTDALTVAGHGRPWIDQQWLAHVLLYDTWRVGGYPLVGLVSAASIGLAFAILALALLRRGTSPVRTVIWCTFAFFVCQPNTATRAQSFAYPLFAGAMCVLLADEDRREWSPRLLLLVPLLALWANLHGSVVMGAALATGYLAWRALRAGSERRPRTALAYLLTGAASAAAGFATPYGTAVFGYYRSVLDNPALKTASAEWQATTFSPANLQFILLALILVSVASLGVRRGFRPSPLLVALCVVLGAGAVESVRNQTWFAFPAVAFVTATLSAGVPAPAPASRRPRAVAALGVLALLADAGFVAFALAGPATERLQVLLLFVGTVLGAALLGLGTMRRAIIAGTAIAAAGGVLALLTTTTADFERMTPRAAVASAIRVAGRHPAERVLADDFASGPLLWRAPALAGRVELDSRFEVFRPADLERYASFVRGDRGPFAGAGIVVVSDFQNPALAGHMRALPGWRTLARDGSGSVFVRRS